MYRRSGKHAGNNEAGPYRRDRNVQEFEAMNRRLVLRLAAAAAVVCAVPSFAGDVLKPKGVVELFTSQGCNSCPPADAALAELAEKGDVVALGYHVD